MIRCYDCLGSSSFTVLITGKSESLGVMICNEVKSFDQIFTCLLNALFPCFPFRLIAPDQEFIYLLIYGTSFYCF